MDLINLLQLTISNDISVSETAQEMIDNNISSDLGTHLTYLVNILVDCENCQEIRKAAAVQIVNTFQSGDPLETRIDHSYRWFSIDENCREDIKAIAHNGRPCFVAECLTFIAQIEFCQNHWPDLINKLINNINAMNNPDSLKEDALEIIGALADRFKGENCEQLLSYSSEIFDAIFRALKDENSNDVKISAMDSLMHWMRFVANNPQNENDAIAALDLLCSFAENSELLNWKLKVVALKSLVGILKNCNMSLSYLAQIDRYRLFTIMRTAIESTKINIKMEGFRLCQELCFAEGSAIKFIEAQSNSWNHSKAHLPDLLRILVDVIKENCIETRRHQNKMCLEIATACLSTLASFSDNSAVESYILTFFKTNINSDDWQLRNASIVAFNSISWGSDDNIEIMVQEVLPELLRVLHSNDHTNVLIAAAISIQKFCVIVAKSELLAIHIEPTVDILLFGLTIPPKISSIFCKALKNFADETFEQTSTNKRENWMVEYYDEIVEKLLETMNRSDADGNLLTNAYEALKGIVDYSPKNSCSVIKKITPVIIQQLLQIDHHKLKNCDMHSSLLSVLQTAFQKMPVRHISQFSHLIIPSLLQVFMKNEFNSKIKAITLYTIATLVKKLEDEFMQYVSVLQPFLMSEIKNPRKNQVCIAVLQLLHCLCQSLGNKMTCFFDDIVPLLLKHLLNAFVSVRLKEDILLLIGEITRAVGPCLINHENITKSLMKAQGQIDELYMKTNRYFELHDVHNKFLIAYGGILHGFKDDEITVDCITRLLDPHLNRMIQVIIRVTESNNENKHQEVLITNSVQFLCTFINCFNKSVLYLIDTRSIKKLLVKGSSSEIEATKRLSILTMEKLIKLKRQALSESCKHN